MTQVETRTPSAAVRTPTWALLACLAAVLTLAAALATGGGALGYVLPGLTDPGPLTRWGLPLARLVLDAAATVTVGFLLLAVLLPAPKGNLSADALRALRVASLSALAWAAAAAAAHVLTLSDLIGLPLVQSLGGRSLASFTFSVEQGQAYALVLMLTLVLVVLARFTLRGGGALAMLVLGLAALVPPALTGHSSSGDYHHSAATSLVVHVVAIAIWVGGLVALATYAGGRGRELSRVAHAFSPIALASLVAVGASGILNAVVRMDSLSQLASTPYGRMVLLKICAIVVLAGFGARHRRASLRRLDDGHRSAFRQLAAGEIVVMAATMGLAVGLSRTPPPVPEVFPDASRARELLGYPIPPEPTAARLLTETYPDAFFALLCLAMAGTYLAAVWRLRRRGDSWPIGRTVSWLAGTGLLLLVMVSGLMTYGMTMLSVHMGQHMITAMAIPPLLVLGGPITLALRAIRPARRGERGARERILSVLHSRLVRVLTHPVVAFAVFVTAAPMVYFSGLFEFAMFHHTGHLLMALHFLLGGYLFYEVVIGIDPLPKRPPHVVRVVMVLAAAGFHAFFGVALLMATNLVAGDWYRTLGRDIAWLPEPLADQQVAAQITWGFGELPALLVLLALLAQWARSDERAAARRDRRANDDELDRYNAHLAGLAERSGEVPREASGRESTQAPSGTLGSAPTGGSPSSGR